MTSKIHSIVRAAALMAAIAGCAVHAAPGPVIPEGCEGQREDALSFIGGAAAVEAWTPNRPFTLQVDAAMFDFNGALVGIENFTETQILEPLRDLDWRFFQMHGYHILDFDSPPDEHSIRIVSGDVVFVAGWGYPYCPGYVGVPVVASPPDAAVVYTRHFFNPGIQCIGYRQARHSESIVHEIAHVFGMAHDFDEEADGVPMSENLTNHGRFEDSDDALMDSDVRNMGCILPYRHFSAPDPEVGK